MREQSRLNPVATGVATSIVVLVAMVGVIASGLPGGLPIPGLPHGMQLRAALADADGLAPHASVQIAGVKIGEVRAVALGTDNRAVATLEIDSRYSDIHSDGQVLLRPHGLFGPKFVELQPGTGSAPLLHDGDTIAGSAVAQPVDLDQVLSALQKDERVNLRTALTELGKAAAGRGDDVNHLFTAARSLTDILDSPVRSLGGVSAGLDDLLVQDEAFNASFAQAPLDVWVAKSNRALQALADNSDHLASILGHANTTLANLDAALAGQTGNLRASLEQLPPLIDKLDRFNDLLSLFAATLTGKDGHSTDVTSGVIGAIENIRSAFSSYDPCTPGVGTCPKDGPNRGQAHYLRVQAFNVSAVGNPAAMVCTSGAPALGPIIAPAVDNCRASATVDPAPAAVLASDSATTLLVGSLLTP